MVTIESWDNAFWPSSIAHNKHHKEMSLNCRMIESTFWQWSLDGLLGNFTIYFSWKIVENILSTSIEPNTCIVENSMSLK
jgi:hypothetical protein